MTLPNRSEAPAPSLALAEWARPIARSAIQDALATSARPGVLSLGLGLPAAELFPAAILTELTARVLGGDPRALQYVPSLPALKAEIAKLMARRGVTCKPEQVFLTTGAQQGMNLIARLLLEPGGAVVMEDRIYTGFQQLLDPFQPRRLTVGTDLERGIDVDAVEALLRKGEKPAFLYAMSEGHNPLSLTMPLATRQRLVAVAREHRLPVIEDDAYGLLTYEDAPLPSLRALEDRWVLYVGSFSKILAPALRIGWLVVPEELMFRLSIVKEASDIDTVTLSQRLALAFLEGGYLDQHLAGLKREYRARRDAMLRSLQAHMPEGARWTRPTSGMFIWLELREDLDTLDLLGRAVEEEQVAFLPGQAFVVPGGRSASHCIRLNFTHCAPDLLDEGVQRLARVIKRAYAKR